MKVAITGGGRGVCLYVLLAQVNASLSAELTREFMNSRPRPGRCDPPVTEKGRALAWRSPRPLPGSAPAPPRPAPPPRLEVRSPAGHGRGVRVSSSRALTWEFWGGSFQPARVVGGSVSWRLSDWSPRCLAGCWSGSEAALGSLLTPPHHSSRRAPSGHVPLVLGMCHKL